MNWFKSKPTQEEKARFVEMKKIFDVPIFHKPIDRVLYMEKLKTNPDYPEYVELKKKFSGGKTRKRKKKSRYNRIKS